MSDRRPARLVRALEAQARWRESGVHLVPIRHHSPGCATALRALLDDVRPVRVLIEGPREYTSLLPVLADERTKPPLAILSTFDSRAAFYPLADFSPEWVALRWGTSAGAVVDFIDQPYALQRDDESVGVRTLQAEQHLSRSASIARLAAQLGCRDADEVWEHLFEVRGVAEVSDWRGYFADVLAWGALARLDCDRELLDGDGTHGREAVMAAMIERHRAEPGPIVIVTGAFHTMALLDVLDETPESHWVRAHDHGNVDATREAWLIRYDYKRLDSLRGYGAGMPAPGFWERAWRARRCAAPGHDAGRELVVDVLLDIAAELRTRGEPLGAATIQVAAEHALRLAALRRRAWPGRTDILDALLSCFVTDDAGLSGPLGEAIADVFGGTDLGELPPGIAAPPLVAEARAEATRLRFAVTDSTLRHVSLDTQRKAGHVRRREFLATMRFIGTGFARQVGGADLVGGHSLGTLHEQWEYAWTPLVEAALIDASAEGPTLVAVVRSRLRERLADESTDSAAIAGIISELLVMGATDELGPVLRLLRAKYDTDPSLGSVVKSLHRLAGFLSWPGRFHLGEKSAEISALLATGLAAVAYQLPSLVGLSGDDLADACSTLISLRSVQRRLAEQDALADEAENSNDAVTRELRRLLESTTAPAQLRGCLVGLAYCDQDLTETRLRDEVIGHLRPGVDPDRVAAFLRGLLQAAPDLLLRTPDLLVAVDGTLASLPEEAFLAVLPDLRQAFTWLKPAETHQLAGLVAHLTGSTATDLDAVLHIDAESAAFAQEIERHLVSSLVRDGLADWAPL